MKIKLPQKKESRKAILLPPNFKFIFTLGFIGGSFIFGILFYLGGLQIERVEEALVEGVEEVAEEIRTEIKLYQSNGLATIFLDIPFYSMQMIEEKRAEALEIGILLASDDDYVPASMRFMNDASISIKLRLKGDWVDHLEGDKWSFRIHITDGNAAVLGMRRFSIQTPETRNFVHEWGFHQNLFLEDILSTRYHFVNVVVNGEHKGIFALEESFTEDLLESLGRRAGVIIRLDEGLHWENTAGFFYNDYDFLSSAINIGFFWLVDEPTNNQISPFRQGRINESDVLANELRAAEELLYSFNQGILSAEEILDTELWGRYFAVSDLWAGGHSTEWLNLRFYYNPINGLLEPVVFDGLALHTYYSKEQLAYPFAMGPTGEIFHNPGVQKAYVETLERITSLDYIELLKNKFGEEIGSYYEPLVKEYENKETELDPQLPWDDLAFRADVLSRNLIPGQAVRGNYHLIKSKGKTFLQLDLVNLMVVPVQVNEIIIGESSFQFEEDWCSTETCQKNKVSNIDEIVILSGRSNSSTPISFLIPLDNIGNEEISQESLTIRVNLYGGSRIFDIQIYSNYVPQGIETTARPETTLEDALSAHDFLLEVGETQLAVAQGDWEVVGDLVLPRGYDLIVPENTTFRFDEESVLLSYGKLEFLGREEAPILFTAQEGSWGGIVVLDAGGKSSWRNVKVEKMAGVSRSGWILTGGITFYQSPVEMSHTIIGNNSSEDALNIIRTSFLLDQVEFLNTLSDAFDGDYTDGTVKNCSFHSIGGDAFDVSGSEAVVTNSYFINVEDKAISAGEKSDVSLSDITIRNVNIGIASKDLSTVLADYTIVDSAQVAGLAAFIKKPQYGPASIQATNTEILKTEELAICQINSHIVLNGDEIDCEEIDVDELYSVGD